MSSEHVIGFDDSHKKRVNFIDIELAHRAVVFYFVSVVVNFVLKCSRVLAPPGGKDSVSFTAVQDPTGKTLNPCQVQRNSSNVFEGKEMGIQSKGNVRSCQEARQKSSVFTAPLEPIPVPKKGHHEKSSGNIIAANDAAAAAPEKVHTSVAVRAPPGGVSHISFG